MLVRPFRGTAPKIHESVFIAETAVVIGDVEIGENASIWYGVVLRGDINGIRIGPDTNIQDQAVVHVDDRKRTGDAGMMVLGRGVTVGHGAIIHACRIGDHCLIGMGAIVLSGADVGEGSIIAAGAVVKEGMVIPPHSLVVGIPAMIKTTLPPERCAELEAHARKYAELGGEFRRGG
ncbi:MAG TPA: gamma carbonic anhydrase family protein [Candidatus Ozemobacteraceae bacterium]|nr:gamma carbonic anhydrase family protein [Candidatus Ozemobacteraceae bacterium]